MEQSNIVIDVEVKGIRPLLQNNMGDAEDDGGASKKGQVYVDQEEAEKRLIKNGDDVLCQPAIHLESCMIKSATDFKFKGHKTYKELFKAGVFVDPLFIPHKNPVWEIFKAWVKVQKARIARCRPMFNDWSLAFQIRCTDDRVQPLIIKEVLENAGAYYGIGDWRPRFGLFEVTKFEVNGHVPEKKSKKK